MDLNHYISSGILEAYALGLATEQEVKEVECLSSIYPEIQAHLQELDQHLIELTTRYQLKPSRHVKESTFAELDREFARTITSTSTTSTKTEQKQRSIQPWWIAACIALLAAVGYLFFQNQQFQNQLNDQQAQLEQSQKQFSDAQQELTIANEKSEIITHPNTKQVQLASSENESEFLANVFWNAEQSRFLVSNNLPKAPAGKQYQFWAIVNGNPQDMGVMPLDDNADYTNSISFETVDAFAITLEDEGGSPTPNMDQLKAIGTIA